VRTFIAFLIAPLLPAILPAWYLAQSPNKSGPSAYIFVCCLIYFLEALVGVPAFRLFRRTRHRLWPYLLLGFFTTTVPVAGILVFMGDQHNNIVGTAFITWYFGVLGIFTALIFWLVARPDQNPLSQTPNF
jgi:predicted lysophospholipase L1 biosynthesis ABC-type transport system permease subunit